MSDIHADELIRIAEDDIASAKILLGTTPPILTTAAYHAEQGAEKAVKAALTKLGLGYRHTHEIGALLQPLPADHPFTGRAAKLAVTAPWAVGFRYTDATPPSADEIKQALTDALELTSAVVKTLPPPSTDLTIGLAATSPDEWRLQRIVGLWVDPDLLANAIAPPTGADAPDVRALRTIAETSVHQPEYDLTDPQLTPTGRTLHGWAGVYHVQDLMTSERKQPTKARLYLNTIRLDDAVQANPELRAGFAGLLAAHQKREAPQNPPPSQQRPGGRGGP